MGTEGIYERYVKYYTDLEKSLEGVDVDKLDRKERIEYEEKQEAIRDWYDLLETARLKGEKRGREKALARGYDGEYAKNFIQGYTEGYVQGYIQGYMKVRYATAQKLKSMGASMEMITESTGLTPDEISRL